MREWPAQVRCRRQTPGRETSWGRRIYGGAELRCRDLILLHARRWSSRTTPIHSFFSACRGFVQSRRTKVFAARCPVFALLHRASGHRAGPRFGVGFVSKGGRHQLPISLQVWVCCLQAEHVAEQAKAPSMHLWCSVVGNQKMNADAEIMRPRYVSERMQIARAPASDRRIAAATQPPASPIPHDSAPRRRLGDHTPPRNGYKLVPYPVLAPARCGRTSSCPLPWPLAWWPPRP
jgi:hypothetical protein